MPQAVGRLLDTLRIGSSKGEDAQGGGSSKKRKKKHGSSKQREPGWQGATGGPAGGQQQWPGRPSQGTYVPVESMLLPGHAQLQVGR